MKVDPSRSYTMVIHSETVPGAIKEFHKRISQMAPLDPVVEHEFEDSADLDVRFSIYLLDSDGQRLQETREFHKISNLNIVCDTTGFESWDVIHKHLWKRFCDPGYELVLDGVINNNESDPIKKIILPLETVE